VFANVAGGDVIGAAICTVSVLGIECGGGNRVAGQINVSE